VEEYLKRYRKGTSLDELDKWIGVELARNDRPGHTHDRFRYQMNSHHIAGAKTTFEAYRIGLAAGKTKPELADYVKSEAERWPYRDTFLKLMRGHVKRLNSPDLKPLATKSTGMDALAALKNKLEG